MRLQWETTGEQEKLASGGGGQNRPVYPSAVIFLFNESVDPRSH